MKLSAIQHYLFFFLLLFSFSIMAQPKLVGKQYVGEEACQACHSKEFQEWQGSHHDLAMQEANESTVLGDFNQIHFIKDGITTTFFKQKNNFMVNTDNAQGQLQDYKIAYTFGVYPLQQYMVKFPQGKVQVLDIAWDSRSKEQGGQRWFSLHPNDTVIAGDVLHWTGPNLNWNYMCADCHSTNLKKNYNALNDHYDTQWDSINVSCEACHGPASEHLNWAKLEQKERENKENGLTLHLSQKEKNDWIINPKTGIAQKRLSSNTHVEPHVEEVELCAKCHSRRSQLDDTFIPGDNFRDHYLPSLLTDDLYFSDGKMKDEVYVYGSFAQSKMYKVGVRCSDCHNSHTLDRKAEGDIVCQQCHLATQYATLKHHFHEEQSTGASCIACHMPARTYMGVDERNDHSFRIPRPDLAESLATPDACTLCHKDQNSQWATKSIQKWYGKIPVGYQQFGPVLQALDQQQKEALQLMYGVLMEETPDIAKATLVGFLGFYPSRQTLMTSLQMLRSKSADVRRQALQTLQNFPLQNTIGEIYKTLNDPVKIVRIEAARILSTIPKGSLNKEQALLIESVTEEYRQSLVFLSERPESQLALAQLSVQSGQFQQANAEFKHALLLQKQYLPSYINYAQFLQRQGKETEAYTILKSGLKENNKAAVLHHALGLWYIRNQEKQKGIDALKIAVDLEPDNANYQYIYAVAISETSLTDTIKILEKILQTQSGNMQVLMALSSYYKQLGDDKKALMYRKQANDMMQYQLE